jgi:hypothetical protein
VLSNLGLQILDEASLQQIYRVVKPKGRVIFNLWGVTKTPTSKVYQSVFPKYKVDSPSAYLERIRTAEDVIDSLEAPFRGVQEKVVKHLEKIGFQKIQVKIKTHHIILPNVQAYLDMTLYVNDVHEVAEMESSQREAFIKELAAGLEKLAQPEGIVLEPELYYYMGTK